MQFVLRKKVKSEGPSDSKDSEWTIEKCEEYLTTNRRLSANKHKQPLHELLQGMHIEIVEPQPVLTLTCEMISNNV